MELSIANALNHFSYKTFALYYIAYPRFIAPFYNLPFKCGETKTTINYKFVLLNYRKTPVTRVEFERKHKHKHKQIL